jgi:hypothetical protein
VSDRSDDFAHPEWVQRSDDVGIEIGLPQQRDTFALRDAVLGESEFSGSKGDATGKTRAFIEARGRAENGKNVQSAIVRLARDDNSGLRAGVEPNEVNFPLVHQ